MYTLLPGSGMECRDKYFPSVAKMLGLILSSANKQDKDSLRQISSSLRHSAPWYRGFAWRKPGPKPNPQKPDVKGPKVKTSDIPCGF